MIIVKKEKREEKFSKELLYIYICMYVCMCVLGNFDRIVN